HSPVRTSHTCRAGHTRGARSRSSRRSSGRAPTTRCARTHRTRSLALLLLPSLGYAVRRAVLQVVFGDERGGSLRFELHPRPPHRLRLPSVVRVAVPLNLADAVRRHHEHDVVPVIRPT